jgi:hypothetical protein
MSVASINTLLDAQLLNTYFFQLHTGDPGAAGTANVSSVTTRIAATWAAASGGSKALSAASVWAAWAGTNGEIVTHISVWTLVTAGTFKESLALSLAKTLNTGDIPSLSTYTRSFTPVAA